VKQTGPAVDINASNRCTVSASMLPLSCIPWKQDTSTDDKLFPATAMVVVAWCKFSGGEMEESIVGW